MSKRVVTVTQLIEVDMDDSKFDANFMAEFVASFFPYDTLEEHARHLAQLYARGIATGFSDDFIEGYGPVADMGIRFHEVDIETELEAKP